MYGRYEGLFLISLKAMPDAMPQETRSPEELAKDILETLQKEGATIVEERVWDSRRQLAYPIKKQAEAMYYLVIFDMAKDKVNKVRDTFRIKDGIIRFLITSLEK